MKRPARCLVCGKAFAADRITQKYCSPFCRRYAHRHGMNDHAPARQGTEPLRTFRCVRCGVLVKVTDRNDRRQKFCSARCERLYWKHAPKKLSRPVRRIFTCRHCGTEVRVVDSRDKRTVFCSPECRNRWFSEHRKA